MHRCADRQRLHSHVLTINPVLIQNRWLASQYSTGRLVAKWKRRAARREIAHLALCIQGLDHDTGVAVRVDDTQGKLTWPVWWSGRHVLQHIQHGDPRLSTERTIHALINGICGQE